MVAVELLMVTIKRALLPLYFLMVAVVAVSLRLPNYALKKVKG